MTTSDQAASMNDLIATHLARLHSHGYAETTIEGAARFLYQADRALPYGLNEAHPDELRALLDNQAWKAWTRHTYDAHLRRYYALEYAAGELASDPIRDIRHPPSGEWLPNPASLDELRQALRRSGDPWRTAIMLAAYAGLRASELARIRRQDVTEEWVTIRLGKGGRSALVDTSPVLWAYLRDLPAGPLVLHRGAPVTGRWLSNRQSTHFKKIDMPQLHLHRFRHTFGTELLRHGADVRTVQELLRHKSLMSTMIYTAVAAGHRRSAIAALPAVA